MKTYPVCLVGLEHQRTVVIGGGSVAARKVTSLLEAGAKVVVISPVFAAEFAALRSHPSLELLQRPYHNGDLAGALVVIAATDLAAVNQQVWEEASRRGCLINVVDDAAHSNFIVPAVVQRGEVKIAVSTGGGSPALARRLRQRLEALVGPEYGLLAALLAELRPVLLRHFAPGPARLEAALRLVDSDLLELLRTQGYAAARQRAEALLEVNLSSREAQDASSLSEEDDETHPAG